MNNLEKWLISIEPEKVIEEIQKRACSECPAAEYCKNSPLKECIERTKQMHTDIEKVHKEMWSAVKDRNEDAFAALSQEFERSSRILAEEWAQTSALAKIAVISESND